MKIAKPATNAVSSISENRRNYVALAGFKQKLQAKVDEIKAKSGNKVEPSATAHPEKGIAALERKGNDQNKVRA